MAPVDNNKVLSRLRDLEGDGLHLPFEVAVALAQVGQHGVRLEIIRPRIYQQLGIEDRDLIVAHAPSRKSIPKRVADVLGEIGFEEDIVSGHRVLTMSLGPFWARRNPSRSKKRRSR